VAMDDDIFSGASGAGPLDRQASELTTLANAIIEALLDDGVERELGGRSPLAAEVQSAPTKVAAHFLGELPRHCTMLSIAIVDAATALPALGLEQPFSAVVVGRALLEAAADLHWLATPAIDSTERIRRTFVTYLNQLYSDVRAVEQFSGRVGPDHGVDPAAVTEGWAMFTQCSSQMEDAGHALTRTQRNGKIRVVEDARPKITQLVDDAVRRFYGTTGRNVYSDYSSVAHAVGSGLGTLLSTTDIARTEHGTRHRFRLDDRDWDARIVNPCLKVGLGATLDWLALAHPDQVSRFRQLTS
jgi:hypothetical protein